MANLPEQPTYDAGVYQLETTDPVQGHDSVSGNLGVSNQPLLNLANRTAYLYQTLLSVLNGTVIPPTVAPIDSPEFTGSPTAPTPALGDNSTRLATTAFVQGTVSGIATINCAGSTNITLTPVQAGSGILQLTGILSGLISLIVPSVSGQWTIWNQTGGSGYTVTIRTASTSGTGVVVRQGGQAQVFCDGTNVWLSHTDYTNAQLTGLPTVVSTIPGGDSTARVASTAFVSNAVGGMTVKAVSAGNVLLSPADAGVGQIVLNGTLTAPVNVIWPTGELGHWVVANKTSGPFSVTLSTATASGADVILPQGQSVVVYSDGTNMVLAGSAASSSFSQYSFTATAAQTTFSAPYTPGNIVVFVNGASQAPSDVTATDGANVILTGYNGGNGAFAGDDIELVAFSSFTVANALTVAGGALSGPMMLSGGDTGVTPAQFNNSTLLATTAFVERSQGNASGAVTVQASGSITAAQAGMLINVGTVGTTQTINTAGLAVGTRFTFVANYGGTGTTTIANNGGGTFNSPAVFQQATLVLNAGETVSVIYVGGASFIIESNAAGLRFSTSFLASLAVSGYQKLPSGLILQWGTYLSSSTPTAPATVTFPIAFPTAPVSLITSQGWTPGTTTFGFSAGSWISRTQASFIANQAGQGSSYWVLGY